MTKVSRNIEMLALIASKLEELCDVMPIDRKILGFSNIWYKEAVENAISKTIKK